MKKGLSREIGERSVKILILGSFPGEVSLREREYYANKSNQFWEMIFDVIGEPLPREDYDRRRAILKRVGIGLWDVIYFCDRKGSTDQNIRNSKINNLEILNQFPKLKGIFFNGKMAEKLFNKHYEVSDLYVSYLSSTSRLNPQRWKDKFKYWKKIKPLLK